MSAEEKSLLPDPNETGTDEDHKEKKKKKKSSFRRGVLTGVLTTIAAVAVVCIIAVTTVFGSDKILSLGTVNKLFKISELISDSWYKDADTDTLREGLCSGLVSALGDEYSEYYTPEEAEEEQNLVNANYAGFGALLAQDKTTGATMVRRIYDNSPASRCGISVGDTIVSVDGQDTTSMEPADIAALTRGEEGTTFTLVYAHDGVNHPVTITREVIDIPTVSSRMLDSGIGYIAIAQFGDRTDEEFSEALTDLKNQGMTGVILDLRDNGGGLVQSSVNMLNDLLPQCKLITVKSKSGSVEEIDSDGTGDFDLPIVILMNGNTASASEIFAGSLHDYDKAVLIGEKSYGKGVIQSQYQLSDGSVVKLTTQEYFLPNGESIQGKGIDPDYTVEYNYSGNAEETASRSEEELTNEDYYADSQIKAGYDYLTTGSVQQ